MNTKQLELALKLQDSLNFYRNAYLSLTMLIVGWAILDNSKYNLNSEEFLLVITSIFFIILYLFIGASRVYPFFNAVVLDLKKEVENVDCAERSKLEIEVCKFKLHSQWYLCSIVLIPLALNCWAIIFKTH